eukprot:10243419-Ditylum_brightwellii.AAC.1
MALLCEYHLSLPSGQAKYFNDQTKVLALEPLTSCSAQSAVSVMIAFKTSASTAGVALKAIQVALKDRKNDTTAFANCNVDKVGKFNKKQHHFTPTPSTIYNISRPNSDTILCSIH